MTEFDVLIKYQCGRCTEKFLLGVKDREDYRFYITCPVCGSEEAKGIEITRINGDENAETKSN